MELASIGGPGEKETMEKIQNLKNINTAPSSKTFWDELDKKPVNF
jgi:hypothetical protein